MLKVDAPEAARDGLSLVLPARLNCKVHLLPQKNSQDFFMILFFFFLTYKFLAFPVERYMGQFMSLESYPSL